MESLRRLFVFLVLLASRGACVVGAEGITAAQSGPQGTNALLFVLIGCVLLQTAISLGNRKI
jgi:hypothetical protein